MEDGGYAQHLLWLSQGWDLVQKDNWVAPLYWRNQDDTWWVYTFSGQREVNPAEPVTHLSYFEADAYARWAGCRLANEFEWEVAASQAVLEGNFVENQIYHPLPLSSDSAQNQLHQFFGDAGNGHRVRMLPTPDIDPAQERSGNITGNGCAINMCCVGVPVRPRKNISVVRIVISFQHMPDGNSAESDW